VLPIVGATVTTAARHTAHLITLILDIVIIGGLCIYVTYKGSDRSPWPTWWNKRGPTIMIWISFVFVIADPLRHVLEDNNIWEGCNRRCGELWPERCDFSSEMYHCALVCESSSGKCNENDREFLDCTCVHDYQETASHLSMIGILFTIIFTYVGYALFIFSALWSGNLCDKLLLIRHKYRVLRGLSKDSDY